MALTHIYYPYKILLKALQKDYTTFCKKKQPGQRCSKGLSESVYAYMCAHGARLKDKNMTDIFSYLKFAQPGDILLSDGGVIMSNRYTESEEYKTAATRITKEEKL